jgi:Tol biopolymer transport system component
MAVDGSRGSTVVQHPGQDVVSGWTPDGSALLFASDRSGSTSLWLQPLSDRQPRGAPRLIRGGLGGFMSAGVTRNGALYLSVDVSQRDVSVTALELATGKEARAPVRPIQQFVGTNVMPDWSPDGRHLAYVSQRSGLRNSGRIIGIRDMRTGDERALRPALSYFGPIDWAPDGDLFVTAGTDLKGRSGVFTIDARTARSSLIVDTSINAYPKWSSDGRRMFYRKTGQQRYTDVSIVERDLVSGTERTVARGAFGAFSVSPDGTSIAAPMGGIATASARVLAGIRVDTGEVRELMRVGPSERFPPYVAPQWTPDGRAVLVRKRSPNELWLVPLGGTPRKLDVDVREWSFGAVGQMSVHPDGRQVAFLTGRLSSEVMVLENFLPPVSSTR